MINLIQYCQFLNLISTWSWSCSSAAGINHELYRWISGASRSTTYIRYYFPPKYHTIIHLIPTHFKSIQNKINILLNYSILIKFFSYTHCIMFQVELSLFRSFVYMSVYIFDVFFSDLKFCTQVWNATYGHMA